MTLHLKPETEAKLEAQAAARGVSVDEYVEDLVEREVDETVPDQGTFERRNGLLVYRTGEPMTPEMVAETLDAIRREREDHVLGMRSE